MLGDAGVAISELISYGSTFISKGMRSAEEAFEEIDLLTQI